MMTRTGTPSFCAPELFLNQPYTAKVDVWSAGVILYQIVTGQLPYLQQNVPVLIQDIQSKPVDYSHSIFSADVHLKSLLEGMLQKDGSIRPSA